MNYSIILTVLQHPIAKRESISELHENKYLFIHSDTKVMHGDDRQKWVIKI